MRGYEERQTRNRHLHEKRLRHIYDTVEGYQALDESVASYSVAQGKKMLAGDASALEQLRQRLSELAGRRASLLIQNGYPENVPTAGTPDISTGRNVIASARQKFPCCTSSPT